MIKKFLICSITLVMALLTFSCNTVDQEPDYTFAIKGVWWSDSLDTNGDGFAQYKRLNLLVHLNENVSSKIVAVVNYKLIDASDYSIYASVNYNLQGNNINNEFYIPIGSPNKGLVKGFYDFKVEVYQEGSNRIEAVTDSSFDHVLKSNAFETVDNDNNFTILPWWSDNIDLDGNGYKSSSKLNFIVTMEGDSAKTLLANIFYKGSRENDYTIYGSLPPFNISAQAEADTQSFVIGFPNTELQLGMYDFKIELYDAENNNLLAFVDKEIPELKEQTFESDSEDNFQYSFSRIWWSDVVDLDNDSFTQIRKLNYDIDVDEAQSRTLFAKIFIHHPDSGQSQYELYDSTANFVISGFEQNDNYFSYVGMPNAEVDSNYYDFFISVYDVMVDSPRVVAASISAFSDTTLANQKFETSKQDSAKVLHARRKSIIR